jgi:hypothetical protein
MSALTDLLEKFNRKERFWLLNDLIGSPFLKISPEFRRKLADETSRPIPDLVWWAFDYHIDWLVAVLRTFPAQPQLNKPLNNEASEIKGNPEDFDLIIAFDKEIILVEAKTGFFSNPELKSKLARLNGIVSTDGITESGVRISFVLSNPKIKKLKKLNEKQFFPAWALKKNGQPFRIDLPIFTNALTVSRCANLLTKHNVPKKDAKGKYWAIYKS